MQRLFYRYGNASGIDDILNVSKAMGLGEKTGIPLNNEDAGFIPNPDWKRAQGLGKWGDADTALVSIGQGATEATALQMAGVAATTSNGGYYYKPRLIFKTVNKAEEEIVFPKPLYSLNDLGIPKEKIEICKSGMWDVVNEIKGTARRGQSEITQVSGKTGTAQTEGNVPVEETKQMHGSFLLLPTTSLDSPYVLWLRMQNQVEVFVLQLPRESLMKLCY